MTVRTRCPGCFQWLKFDDDVKDAPNADQVIETHTVQECRHPDKVLCERLGIEKPGHRQERRRRRSRLKGEVVRRRRRRVQQTGMGK